MSNPVLVTVVTVCRNVKSSLEKTMNSLLHQSYAHIDYVIIDGASTDGTPEMLGKTEGIRWISEPDKGIYDAMNKGIRMAEGEWVIFMNAGDVFASDDTLSKVFSVERDADVIYGDVIKGDNIKKAEPPHNGHRMYFCHQSAFVRTSCLKEFPFDIQHRMSADFKQMKQLYLAGKTFMQLDFPIAVFDTSGVSNAQRSKGLYDNIQVIREVDNWKERLRLLPRLLFTYWMCRLRGA
jgi:glycosyltransferase involved in cell wall biosynthesis